MGLKICYIFTSAGLISDSIQKKVIAQINGLNAAGVKCRGAFFSEDVQVETRLTDNIVLIPYPITNRKYFNTIFQKQQIILKVKNYISKTIEPGEVLYLRYPGASRQLYLLAKKFKNRIISEHQAKEIDEIKSAKMEHPFGFNLSKIISFFLYQLWPIYNEKIWSRWYSKNLFAKIAVTNEIANYHVNHCKNVWVIPNGIETVKFKIREVPQFENELRILFLKGTAGVAAWNGLDRLISSIDSFESSMFKIKLIICGNIIPNEVPGRSYIIQTGYLNSVELDQLFSTVHIGFSTLCLYRKNLEEAAVLKAREYFARGLPFVYAYIDPDLENEESIRNFIMKLSNDNSIINFDKVITFAQNVSRSNEHPLLMRKFAEEKLDWNAKMMRLKNHIQVQLSE